MNVAFKGSKIYFTDLHKPNIHKGRCIVFLHGFLESLEIWGEFSEVLSKSYRIICIDLPGHGKSENIGYVHTMETMADAVKAVLRHLQISKCIMIGHSMGGYVALAFAEKYPENLRGFGLFHSHAAPDSEEKKKDRDRAINLVKRNPKVLINELVPNLFAPENREKFGREIEALTFVASQMTRQGIVNCLEGMKDRADKRRVMERSGVPVLFVLGKKDSVMPYEALKTQSELSGKIQLVTLENSGHMGFIEQKQESLSALKTFIRKCHAPIQK